MTSTKVLRAGILALGLAALAIPAAAQTGNPNNPTGTETPNAVAPKGNIGTSGSTGGVTSPGMSGTTGAGPGMTGGAAPGGPAARDSGPRAGDAPSEVPRAGPKGNIGGN